MRVCIAVYLKPIYKVKKMDSDIYRLKRTYLQLKFLQDLASAGSPAFNGLKAEYIITIYILYSIYIY